MQAQTISVTGTGLTYAAPIASDTVPLGSLLIVKNGSAAAITVTFTSPKVLETGATYPNKVYTIAAAAEAAIPVLDVYRPASGSSNVPVTFSAVTSVTAAAVARF